MIIGENSSVITILIVGLIGLGQRTHSAEPPSNGRKAAIGCLVSYKESLKLYLQLNSYENPDLFERNGDRDKLFCALYVRFMAIKNAVPFINRHYLVQYRKDKLKEPVYDSENAEPKKISDLLIRFGEEGTQKLLGSLQPLVLSLNLPPKEKERRGILFKTLEKNRSQNIFNKLSKAMNKMLEWASNHSRMVQKVNKQAKDENHFLERLAESEVECFGKASLTLDNFFEQLTRTGMDDKYKEPVRMDFEDIVKTDVPNEVEIQKNLGYVVNLIHLIEMNKMKNDFPDFPELVEQWEKNGAGEFVVLYSPIWTNI